MHQSIKEYIVLQAQMELLQTSFQDSLAASPLHASIELSLQAEFKAFPIIRSSQVRRTN